MVKLIVPAVAAQVINLLYNIVDRIFIAQIPEQGETALTGVGVSYPILLLISAFASFVGMGAAPLASMRMGAGDMKEANKFLGNGFMMILFFSASLTLIFSVFKEPILLAFGASSETIGYAVDYVSIYVLGTIFVQIALGLNSFITAQGKAKIAMFSVIIGAIINIALDFLFIMVLGYGVKGAATATVIAQACSAAWVMRFLLSSQSVLRLKKENFVPDWKLIGKILALGISPFIMTSTESLVNITLNSNLQKYGNLAFTGGGDVYVGVMTIQQSVMQMIMLPMQGIGQGTLAILSFNYGAKNFDRVREAFKKLICADLIFTCVGCAAAMTFPQVFASIFSDDPLWLETCAKTMPIFFAGVWALGAQNACQVSFMAMGQAKTSLFLACLRKIILLIPLAMIFPRVTGDVVSIFVAEPVADILTSCTTFTIFMIQRKKLLPLDTLPTPKEV